MRDRSIAEKTHFGVYVHWPFCESKCPYCDFNSHVREHVAQAEWLQAYCQEISFQAARLGSFDERPHVTSVFFGGGTPSLMRPETVAGIISALKHHFHFSDQCELTLEANPGSIDRAKFHAFRQAGINRLSLGVQSLEDDVLAFLGRKHDAKAALTAVSLARDLFPRYSFDLIYARPHQTCRQWISELNRAFVHAGDHLSLYQLTIEQGTNFYSAVKRGDWTPLPDDDAAILYEATRDWMAERDWFDYEVSNYAPIGGESRHNLIYWRYQPYLGIGPGAHGRLHKGGGISETSQIRTPESWLKAVKQHGNGERLYRDIPVEERVAEYLIMGLRLQEGIKFTYLSALGGGQAVEVWLDMAKISLFQQQQLLEITETHLRITAEGRLCLNALLPEIFAPSLSP